MDRQGIWVFISIARTRASPLCPNSTHCWSAFELVTTNTLSREREREKVGGGAVFPNWGKTPLARKQLENVKQLIAFGKELLWNPVFLVRGPNSEGSKEKRSKLKSSFCLSIRPPTPTSKNRIESFCSIWGKNGHRAKKKRRCLREVSFRNAHPPVALDLGLGRENFAGKTPASRWKKFRCERFTTKWKVKFMKLSFEDDRGGFFSCPFPRLKKK